MFRIYSDESVFTVRYNGFMMAVRAMVGFAAWDREYATTMRVTDWNGFTLASVTDRVLQPDRILITVLFEDSDYSDRLYEHRFEV